LQLRFDVGLQFLIGGRAGRTLAEGDRLTREFERGRSAEVGSPGCGSRQDGSEQDQERFRAVHIYPSVKFRSRSSESNQGRTSAGGARKSAATKKSGPGKNCRPFRSRREIRRKYPPTGWMSNS